MSVSVSRRAFLRGRHSLPASHRPPWTDQTREALDWQAEIRDHCLALANIHCQSCQDACETRAIRFRPQLNHAPVPEVSPDACTGCGACVAVCPQDAIALE